MKATDQYFPVILFITLCKVCVSKAIVKRARKTCNLFLNIAEKRVEELNVNRPSPYNVVSSVAVRFIAH